MSNLYRRIMSWDGGQFIALLLAVFAVAPLAYPGFFQSYSGFLPIYNLYSLEQYSGLLGLGWMPTVGRTFDLFRGSGSLPYVVAEVFRWLGMSAPQAIMASYAMSFLVAAWAMYRWTRRWLGQEAALLAATLYTYLPYHLMVVYVRGDLSEAWVLALLPVVFWAAHGLCAERRRGAFLLLTLIAFILLCSANLGLALLALPVLVGYVWLAGGLGRVWGVISTLASIVVVTVLAHTWAAHYASPITFEDHFPYLFQFLSSAWNADGQVSDWLNAVPLQVGLPALGLGLLSVVLLWMVPKSEPETSPPARRLPLDRNRRLLWYWLVVGGIAFVLMLSPLRFVWHITGWSHLLTYPWQMMGLLGLSLAVLGGSAIALDIRLRTALVRVGLVTFVILASYNFLIPRFLDFNIDFTPEGKVSHIYDMTPRRAPLAILGDNQVALLDFQLEGPLRHGATVRLNVLWQALRPLEEDYMVFVHAVDGEETIWGQRDTEPLNGEYPTSRWGEGEVVADRYEFRIDLDGPREGYGLAIGMYQTDTGERLSLTNGETRWVVRGE